METLKKAQDYFKKIFGEKNRIPIIILTVGILGMALILFSDLLPENKDETPKENFHTQEIEENELEERLKEMISKIEGAGKTEIMLTFDSSKEYFYAENRSKDCEDGKNKSDEEIVIVDGGSGETPIILKSTEAKIRGVLVICEGGANATVRERITKAVCALLDIPSTRVSVAEMA